MSTNRENTISQLKKRSHSLILHFHLNEPKVTFPRVRAWLREGASSAKQRLRFVLNVTRYCGWSSGVPRIPFETEAMRS